MYMYISIVYIAYICICMYARFGWCQRTLRPRQSLGIIKHRSSKHRWSFLFPSVIFNFPKLLTNTGWWLNPTQPLWKNTSHLSQLEHVAFPIYGELKKMQPTNKSPPQMGKSTINGHFQLLCLSLPGGKSHKIPLRYGFPMVFLGFS